MQKVWTPVTEPEIPSIPPPAISRLHFAMLPDSPKAEAGAVRAGYTALYRALTETVFVG